MRKQTVLNSVEFPRPRRDGAAGRIVLEDVSWRTYESILSDYQGRPGVRLNYDRGVGDVKLLV